MCIRDRHSSGQNQFILELGSLTIGSYTYKVYDYNRRDKEGTLRPIHTVNAERVLGFDRTEEWVKKHSVIDPILKREGKGYQEEVVGRNDLMYYETSRIEIQKKASVEDSNRNQFTVLTLVDGEEIIVRSKANPERSYRQKFLEIVVVPASIGDFVIENVGYQPCVVHKTYLKENYTRYKNHKEVAE
jgi:mannose-6-phosphate isomerase class I